ncbi:MAG TPA: YdeI/OmpD-associated family protein [Streptosporangiaceae bacterium]
MGMIQFHAQLQRRGPAAAVVLDETQVAAVGEGAKRFPVVATVNGYTWRTSVSRMGGEFLLGLSREVRDGAGVQAGDEADVTIELDQAPREAEVPEALAAALAADPQAAAAFERMSFTHRKEYARWITEAKREETRQRRVAQAVEMIRVGKTRT